MKYVRWARIALCCIIASLCLRSTGIAVTIDGPNEAAGNVARGANDFAFKLSAEMIKSSGNDNFVCSPYSVWIPLAALVNATNEPAKLELLAALGAAGLGDEDINIAAARMLRSLTGGDSSQNPLKIASAIFIDQSVNLRQDFERVFADYYRGNAMNVDFGSPDAVVTVNQWASDHTDGLIPSIVKDFGSATAAAVANAIYFSDRWDWEFDPDETAEDAFFGPDGESTAFYMLREWIDLEYYEDERVQAMPLVFLQGGGMMIILPKDGDANALLASMTADYFTEINRSARGRPGKLLLPRFSIDGDIMQLTGALAALGVPLFNQVSAPLTGGLIEEDLPMWISSVSHKAVIELDELGTTAAAVTIMAMEGSAPFPDDEPLPPFEMVCDKPFAFVLYSYTYDAGRQVLFTGVVNQP